MNKRVILKIYGRVQGVLYRTNAKEKATELNLTGFVKNESDGTVGVIAEREENNLKEFVKWCYEGSPNSQVKKIEEKWENYKGEFDNFEIRY